MPEINRQGSNAEYQLVDGPDTKPHPIHPGFRLGVNPLRAYLKALEEIGVNHVALNLRLNRADIETTLKRLADEILPDFPSLDFTNREKQNHAD